MRLTLHDAFFAVLVQIEPDVTALVPNHFTHSELEMTVSGMNFKMSLMDDSNKKISCYPVK